MSNSYTTWTGMLVLKQVTPVIKALFSEFELGKGESSATAVYIACVAEQTSPSWDNIAEELDTLCASLGVNIEQQAGIGQLLAALAGHFHCAEDPKVKGAIEAVETSESVGIEELFVLAQHFDDGHGLKSIEMEGAHFCDKPRLYEFGGYGMYLGKHFDPTISSHRASSLGALVNDAIEAGQIDKAANGLHDHFDYLLQCVVDPAVRQQIKAKLVADLAFGGENPLPANDALQAMKLKGLTFENCVEAYADGESDPYVIAAMNNAREGEIEVDSNAVVSRGSDAGAYVMAWKWVSNQEAGVFSNSELLELLFDHASAGQDVSTAVGVERHLRQAQLAWLEDTITNFADEVDNIETETPIREPQPIHWTAEDNSTVVFKPSEALVALLEIAKTHGDLLTRDADKIQAFCATYGEKLDAMLTVLVPEV